MTNASRGSSRATPTTRCGPSSRLRITAPEPDLPKIKAKVLLINTVEDEANPPELGTVERAMKKIHDGRYVLIPYSDQTHGHFTHYYAEVWKPYLISFMGSLGSAAVAR